jgi:hypothetical protein
MVGGEVYQQTSGVIITAFGKPRVCIIGKNKLCNKDKEVPRPNWSD